MNVSVKRLIFSILRCGTFCLGIVVLSFLVVSEGFSQTHLVVKGRVVDESGSVRAGVAVCFETPPCRSCLDQLGECTTSDSYGMYFLSPSIPKGVKEAFVWAVDEPSKESQCLIRAPMPPLRPSRMVRRIALGTKSSRSTIDMGDLLLVSRYMSFELDLKGLLFDSSKSRLDHESVTFLVRDSRGKQMHEEQSVEGKFWLPDPRVKLQLPSGGWIVDVIHTVNGMSLKPMRFRVASRQKGVSVSRIS